MALANWVRRLFGAEVRRPVRKRSPQSRTIRLWLEELENRVVPAAPAPFALQDPGLAGVRILPQDQLAHQAVVVGDTLTLTAEATGSPTPTVQWMVSSDNGATFANISGNVIGATSTTLKVPNVTLAMHNNQYKAVFTNSF